MTLSKYNYYEYYEFYLSLKGNANKMINVGEREK